MFPAPRRRSRLKRLGILVSGWLFVVLGVAGLVLPILQGVLFLFIGFYLLSLELPWAKRLMNRFAARHPTYAARLENARIRAARVARRLYRWR
jgi:uncharacterized membrane protein YbaN (DUF454 family)